MCASCKEEGETSHTREFPVEFLRTENHITIYIVDHDVTDTDMSDEEYDEALAEQFESADDSKEISFQQWRKQRETKQYGKP